VKVTLFKHALRLPASHSLIIFSISLTCGFAFGYAYMPVIWHLKGLSFSLPLKFTIQWKRNIATYRLGLQYWIYPNLRLCIFCLSYHLHWHVYNENNIYNTESNEDSFLFLYLIIYYIIFDWILRVKLIYYYGNCNRKLYK